MNWGLQILPDMLLIRVFGTIDQNMRDMFEKTAERSVSLSKRKVIVDFSQADGSDSLGLVLCGYGVHHLQTLGIPVALICPPTSLLGVLESHGLKGIPSVFSHTQGVSAMN